MKSTTRRAWIVFALFVITFLLVLAYKGTATAHDHWISRGGYTDAVGTHCCGPNDCFVIPDTDMQSTPAGWQIISTGEVIPFAEAKMSEDAQFWRCKKLGGERRCFFAPNMGF